MILINPGDTTMVQFDWSDVLSATSPTASLYSVTHSVPSYGSPEVAVLTLASSAFDVPSDSSSVLVSGGEHGQTYVLTASAVLDNGETINLSETLRCVEA